MAELGKATQQELKEIASTFQVYGDFVSGCPYGSGHINDTYQLTYSVGGAPMLQLQQGDMVEHTAFGKGMVLSVRPMGGDAQLEVAFDQVGSKKLMLKAAGAHMKKL